MNIAIRSQKQAFTLIFCLFFSSSASVLIANRVYMFDLFDSISIQFIKLVTVMALFVLTGLVAGIFASKKDLTITGVIQSYSKKKASLSAVIAVSFCVFALVTNDFEGFWPTPIPVCTSLFLLIALASSRYEALKEKPLKDFLIELALMISAFVTLTEIYKHVLDLWANNLLSILIILYLSLKETK